MRQLILLTLIALVGLLPACKGSKATRKAPEATLTACPEAWYENQMPTTDGSTPSQYFVLQGKRHEATEANMAYVEQNCPALERQIVR